MTIDPDIQRAIIARAKEDTAFRKAVRSYFGQGRTATHTEQGTLRARLQAPGLQLLNTLSRVPQITNQEERALYKDLVELALDRPELRADLMPLLMQMHPEE